MIKMRHYIFSIIIFISILSKSQNSNYFIYHIYINKAETFFFLDNNVDSALHYYDKAFDEFDFIFVKDALIASQIAYFSNREYKKYLVRGFDYGLKFNHLEAVKLFEPVIDEIKNDKYLQSEYKKRRLKYINGLDLEYRKLVYEKSIQEQFDKSKSNFDEIITKQNTEYWMQMTKEKGFPANKIIGINDRTIFSEIGKPEFDFVNFRNSLTDGVKHMDEFELDLLSSHILIMLYHNKCAFLTMESMFRNLIKKGEIHPREVGLLYDNMYGSREKLNCDKPVPHHDFGVFRLDIFVNYNSMFLSDKKNDFLRKIWFVVPISVDKSKKEYVEKYGFRLFFGRMEMTELF
jgi:hypothetical protein